MLVCLFVHHSLEERISAGDAVEERISAGDAVDERISAGDAVDQGRSPTPVFEWAEDDKCFVY